MATNLIRSFVAVDVFTPEIIRAVRAIQQDLQSAGIIGKPVDLESLHITLIFLGELEPPLVEKVKESLSGIDVRPMRLVLKGVGYFPGGSRINTVWIGVEDAEARLAATQREVVSRLAGLGFRPDKEFKPHITILRVKSVRNKSEVLAKISELSSQTIGEVVVDRVRLKKSTLTPQGPIYEDLQVYGPTAPSA
ncbi:MAG: RNA 2',3'-cyclic phosphodiesterase [Nitrososphaerota archaeon]|nr:RNA 2',3'-cyclic phosphodiesterase [Candidatus Calditenuaceae archaeon]MDW8073652.1 RNA 2',3'-cyclic phosphodiesterase [Nitrososphaerota archaeon]